MSNDKQFAQISSAQTSVPDAAIGVKPGSLTALLGRIEKAVEHETNSIRTDTRFDIKASNARKSRYLYELTRVIKNVGDTDILAEHGDGLRSLREKLTVNESVIRNHLSAVTEVATMMQDAIQKGENDGTYSAGEFGWVR